MCDRAPMSIEPRGARPGRTSDAGRTKDFFVGGAVSGTVSVVFGAIAWVWVSRGKGSLPDAGADTWLTAVLVFAFVLAFAAVVLVQRRSLAWGVVAGAAAAVVVDLTGLFLSIVQQSA